MKYIIFGDSITHGYWDEQCGWARRFQSDIFKKTLASDFAWYGSVYELGIPGDTSEGLLKRFKNEFVARYDEEVEHVVIFAIGLNDAQRDLITNQQLVPPEKFKENIGSLIQQAQEYVKKIIIIGPTPVNEKMTDPLEWMPTRAYRNSDIQTYNNFLSEICEREHLTFIDLFTPFVDSSFIKTLDDGVHPNTKGHEMMYDVIKGQIIF